MNGPEIASRLAVSVRAGADWLAARQNDDGSFLDCGNELVSLYKAVLAYARSGRIENGIRCLRYIKQHNLNAEGELCSGDGSIKTGFAHNQRGFANYMDGWVAIGAWLFGDYELADHLAGNLERQQAPLGGVLTGPEKWSGRARFDILTGASCGRAFLLTDRRGAALGVADFLSEVLDRKHQRDRKTGLDMSFDADFHHVDPPDPDDRPYYRFLYDRPGERVFCPAFACAFLCEVAQIADRPRYLEAAHGYFEVIAQTYEAERHVLANGKSGWASGMVALATGDERSSRMAHAIIPRVLARQRQNGEFASASPPAASVPTAKALESTAEHTAWAAQYLRMVSFGLWTPQEVEP